MKSSALIFAVLLISCVFSVDENKFKKCSQSGFCARHRSKPMKLHYTIDPSTVRVENNKFIASLVPSKEQTTDLEFVTTVLPNDLIRVHIKESNPLNDRERFEATDVLMSAFSKEQSLILSSKTDKQAIVESFNKHTKLVIDFTPFHLDFYVNGVLKISVNDNDLFYFEITRAKVEPPKPEEIAQSADKPEEIAVSADEPPKERKIVDYTEAGHAIYDDGTIENPDEDGSMPYPEDDYMGSEMYEDDYMESEVPVDNADVPEEPKPAEENNNPSTPEPTPEDPDKEDETGYWSEYFGGKNDKKPYGPQSVGFDVTFHNARSLYGIPQHSSSLQLQTTVNGHYPDPYRMFNLDVFEYATDKNTALYGSVPFVMAHAVDSTVGLLMLNPSDSFVDVFEKEGKLSMQWMCEAGVIDLFFFPGGSPATLLNQYTQLTSRPYFPPFFSLGYHQSRWNYLDEKDVREVSEKFEELNFPYDVIWLDIEHTVGKKYFTWDSNNFPKPAELVQFLADHGHKLVTIVDPHVKSESGYRISDELKKLDYFIKDNNGNVFEGWCWPGSSNYPDFTDERVREWWGDQFLPENYDGSLDSLYTWNDMNEPSVFDGPEVTMPRDCVSLSGHEHREWHNIYGYYYHNACMEGQKRRSPKQRPFVLTRSFFAGSQRNGPMWTGDVFSNWEHMKYALPMMLTLGMAGIPFVGADVPGFFKDPTEELAIRWYQFGAWTPFFRAHAHIDTKRREPWTFSDETLQILRQTVIDRYSFLPAIYTAMWQTHTTGAPAMRPLVFAFPDDAAAMNEDKQFLFGDSLLIVPVTQEGANTVTAYVPKGQWCSVYDYSMITGGREVTMSAPLEHIAVYQKAGSVVPRMMRVRRSASQMKNDPFTLIVVADEKGQAEGYVFDDARDGYGYEDGLYAYMHITLKDRVLKSVKAEGKYVASNIVERIVIRTKIVPKRVTVSAENKQWQAEFLYDSAKSVLTIRKPEVKMTSEWEIKLE